MRSAIDTNVVSAIWGGEPSAERASTLLDEAAVQGALVISPMVYVELRAHPGISAEIMDEFLETMRIAVDWTQGREVWELASERFERYAQRRRRQGWGETKRFVADFLVASHALLHADRLLTFEQRTYRTDFPELRLG
jgi:hypothetical protein